MPDSTEINTNMELIDELEEDIIQHYLECDSWKEIVENFSTPEQEEELRRLYKEEGMEL